MTETVVFLPEQMCDVRLFGPQISDLSRDYAVMYAPLSDGGRIEEIASSLLDLTPMRFALVGQGMGGIVAMELYRRAPDRVTRLALIGTTPLPDTPQVAAMRDPQIIRARSGRFDEVLSEEVRLANFAYGPHQREVLAMALDMARGLGSEVFVRQARAMQRRRDQQSTLRRINVPTLVLCGAEDAVYPVKRHNFMAEMIPKAELQVVDGAGRMPTLEQADIVTRALRDWLAQPLLLR